MIEITAANLCFIGVAGFVGAFVDSVVGGGGLITTPSLLAIGLPVPYALGTNKVSVTGSITSFMTFYKAGKIDKKIIRLMPFSILGGAMGAWTVNYLPEHLMKNIVVCALVGVALYTFFRKDWGDESQVKPFSKNAVLLLVLLALGFGYYDGFFGPGTGTFLLFAFLNFGYSFINASGNAKALNLGSNIGALIVFALSSRVILPFAVVMAIGQILGARIGTIVAIKQGAKYVRPLFLLITTLLIGKQVIDLFWK